MGLAWLYDCVGTERYGDTISRRAFRRRLLDLGGLCEVSFEGSAVFLHSQLMQRPSLLGWRPSLVGWRPLLLETQKNSQKNIEVDDFEVAWTRFGSGWFQAFAVLAPWKAYQEVTNKTHTVIGGPYSLDPQSV